MLISCRENKFLDYKFLGSEFVVSQKYRISVLKKSEGEHWCSNWHNMRYHRVWCSRRLYSLIFSSLKSTRSNSKTKMHIKSLMPQANSGKKTNIFQLLLQA